MQITLIGEAKFVVLPPSVPSLEESAERFSGVPSRFSLFFEQTCRAYRRSYQAVFADGNLFAGFGYAAEDSDAYSRELGESLPAPTALGDCS